MMNHLWQSTLFAIVAAFLAILLKQNRARLRYWVWLAASVKFLIPFAPLVTLGQHVSPYVSLRKVAPPDVTAAQPVPLVIQRIAEPFSRRGRAAAPAAFDPASILLGLWACGVTAVAVFHLRRWIRMNAAVRRASPLPMEIGIPVMSSPASIEPGVWGIFRPVLLLPRGIEQYLTPEQLQAILAHELCHVRRRDNLTASIQMMVEAVFWFHPLVWWIGTRLVDERERACDEAVLESGSEPEVYAEGILNVCRLYLESPLACVAGVTGSNLKTRIENIMAHRVAPRLTWAKKLLLAAAASAAVAGPVWLGILSAPLIRAQPALSHLEFDVASVRPNNSGDPRDLLRPPVGGRLSATNVTLSRLLIVAYRIQPFQLSGGPSWSNSDRFDIEAKAAENASTAQVWLMLQSLLASRFQAKVHLETRELPVYELRVAKGGPKFKEGHCVGEPGPTNPCGGYNVSTRGRMMGRVVTMPQVAEFLSNYLRQSTLDKTNLAGKYDLDLTWTPDESMSKGPGDPGEAPPDPSGPSIFTALQEQLGLRLESAKGPVEILVIDHAEKPSGN